MYYQVKHPSAWVSTQVAYILYVYKINFKVTTYATKMALNHETDSWDFSGRVLPKHTTQAQLCFHWVPWHEVKYQAHNERVCWLFFFFGIVSMKSHLQAFLFIFPLTIHPWVGLAHVQWDYTSVGLLFFLSCISRTKYCTFLLTSPDLFIPKLCKRYPLSTLQYIYLVYFYITLTTFKQNYFLWVFFFVKSD